MSEDRGFTGVKVFSATLESDRLAIGTRVTEWLQSNPALRVVDTVTLQSSDSRFHCLTIVLFFTDPSRR